MINHSLVQGLVAGGTAAYLPNRKTPDTWVTAALQVNHLLLLTAETIRFAGLPLGSFGLLVKTAYILAPLSLVASESKVSPLSPEKVKQLNTAYRVGVVASSLATFALGNPVFAAASLSMLAIDVLAQGEVKKIFAHVKKVAALLALAGYGMQVFACQGIMAGMAKISTVVMGGKVCLDWERSLPSLEKSVLPSRCAVHHYYHDDRRRYFPVPQRSVVSSGSSGNMLCRPSVWG